MLDEDQESRVGMSREKDRDQERGGRVLGERWLVGMRVEIRLF